MEQLIDPVEAGELLAQTLWDAAELLARRQEIRAVLDDLQQYDSDELPPLSRSRYELDDQQRRAGKMLDEVNADLDQLTRQLTAAAVSGEDFIRDRELGRALQRTEKALDELTLDESSGESVASEELAGQTTAVVDAYRKLTNLYGGHVKHQGS